MCAMCLCVLFAFFRTLHLEYHAYVLCAPLCYYVLLCDYCFNLCFIHLPALLLYMCIVVAPPYPEAHQRA